MALTSVKYDYNVARVIDTPWNTILNGLNYTKTNVVPIGLSFTYANCYDNGMLLKEVVANGTSTDLICNNFSYNNAVRDYNDPNKYWILNTSYAKNSETSYKNPLIYCANRTLNTNDIEYSVINNACQDTKFDDNNQIVYQDNAYLLVVKNNNTWSGSIINDDNELIWFKKNDSYLETLKSDPVGINSTVLNTKDGNLYLHYSDLGSYNYIDYTVSIINLNTGLRNNVTYFNKEVYGIPFAFPSKIINNHFYIKNDKEMTIVKVKEQDGTFVLEKEIPLDADISTYKDVTSITTFCDGFSYCILNIVDEKEVLTTVNLNKTRYDKNIKSSIQTYIYDEETDTFKRQSVTIIEGSCLLPKNDWKNLYIGSNAGITCFTFDPVSKSYLEHPILLTTFKQFGFDIDERLWILDSGNNIYRYTYNQPTILDYKFEKDKYFVSEDPIESYVKVKVLNYSGEYINSKLTIRAAGNFTFSGDQTSIEVTFSSSDYVTIPIIITGSGKYEITF